MTTDTSEPLLNQSSVEPFLDDPAAERERQLRNLALGYRLFAALRWGDTGDGHISYRDPERPEHMWMLRYGISFDRATASDMVLVAPDGSATDRSGATAAINITGYYIHHPIHSARPDIGSAAHVHTQWGTPLAAERRPIQPITQEAAMFYDDVAMFDDEEVQILGTDGGKRIAVALGDKSSVILANHGLLTSGSSVASAVGSFVLLERVAEAHMKAPRAKPISDQAARTARDNLVREQPGWGAFRWLIMRHLDVD